MYIPRFLSSASPIGCKGGAKWKWGHHVLCHLLADILTQDNTADDQEGTEGRPRVEKHEGGSAPVHVFQQTAMRR